MTDTEPLFTNDTLFDGQLVCKQYKTGYRFSIDAVLCSHFCAPASNDTILDIGCGCGVIGLILALRYPKVNITGIEIQHELADLARNNIQENNFESRMTVLEGNYRNLPDMAGPESFDLVISNPPYRKQGRGRLSPDSQRARARHEIDAGLSDLIKSAAYCVKNKGKIVIIYPAVRSIVLITELKKRNLEPKRFLPIYSYPGSLDATLVLIEAVKNGGEELNLLPPFYIYQFRNGPYTDAMQKLYE